MLIGMTMLMGVIIGGWSSILTNYYSQKSAFAHRVATVNACLVSLTMIQSLYTHNISVVSGCMPQPNGYHTLAGLNRRNIYLTCLACRLYILLASFFFVFTARRYAKRGICRRRMSVCLSVTLRYCIKTAKRRITQITPHDSAMILVF